MAPRETILIVGASARAAAFSALRAGLRPWCADLFGDADLRTCCPVQTVPPGSYPEGFVPIAEQGPPGPWMYSGGLENRPALLRRIAKARPLWGNDASVLRVVRSPWAWRRLLRAAGLPCPAVRAPATNPQGRWLVKPLRGAGGTGIRAWRGQALPPKGKRVYLQEFIEGKPGAALYVGDGRRARLLGVTRQLVGQTWLHARPFAYCGCIGPLPISPLLRQGLERLGNTLVGGSGLRGLFGVDFVLKEEAPWPVEVNPRYTASVEILEYGLGISALAMHRAQFDPSVSSEINAGLGPAAGEPVSNGDSFLGKAVLFARGRLHFSPDGPWINSLKQLREFGPWRMPNFADIPPAGRRIDPGRPVLSFFARGATEESCLQELRRIAEDLDHWLGKN